MTTNHHDIIELPKVPAVRFVTDRDGKGYICREGGGQTLNDLQRDCEPEDGVEYGRDFGG